MKKILFVITLFLLFKQSIFAENIFSITEKVPNMYVEEVTDDNFHNGAPFILKKSDGSIVYCINPFQKINETYSYDSYEYNDNIFKLSNEQIDKMNVIAYYGYNYDNHTDIKWYGITQFLIWKTLNLKDIYFTDSYYGNRVVKYEEEILEIEKLVNNHYLLPSFSNTKYEYDPNSNYVLEDLNGVLKNYQILGSNIESEIVSNSLHIHTKENGIYNIKFIKKGPILDNYILYNLDGYQALIYPGKIEDIIFNIEIEVNSGTIIINKEDSESEGRYSATLDGAKYGIYSEDSLVAVIETDNNGRAIYENLPLGKYYIKEITPSKGYNLDNSVYEVNLVKENNTVVVNSKEKVIKGNLIINKYYGDEDNYVLEDGAIFELYNEKNDLIKSYTLEHGKIFDELEYGIYYIKQIKGNLGYKLIEPFEINISENKDYLYNLYDTPEILIVDVPNTFKTDYNIYYSYIFVVFGILIIIYALYKKRQFIKSY